MMGTSQPVDTLLTEEQINGSTRWTKQAAARPPPSSAPAPTDRPALCPRVLTATTTSPANVSKHDTSRHPEVDPCAVFYVRTMASRINEAFRYATAQLRDEAFIASLKIGDTVNDFKLPEPEPTELQRSSEALRQVRTSIFAE
jgi:hypothetical protein